MTWDSSDRPDTVEENGGIKVNVDGDDEVVDEDSDIVSSINDLINDAAISDAIVDATYSDGSKTEDVQPDDVADSTFREAGIIRLDIYAGKENA